MHFEIDFFIERLALGTALRASVKGIAYHRGALYILQPIFYQKFSAKHVSAAVSKSCFKVLKLNYYNIMISGY